MISEILRKMAFKRAIGLENRLKTQRERAWNRTGKKVEFFSQKSNKGNEYMTQIHEPAL